MTVHKKIGIIAALFFLIAFSVWATDWSVGGSSGTPAETTTPIGVSTTTTTPGAWDDSKAGVPYDPTTKGSTTEPPPGPVTPVPYAPVPLLFKFFSLSGTQIPAEKVFEELKKKPEAVRIEITPIDPTKHVYLNASGISCASIAQGFNDGLVQFNNSNLPWYQRYWNKTRSVFGGTFEESVASFKKGDWAVGTGQAIGTVVGETALGVWNLSKAAISGAKKIVVTAADKTVQITSSQTQQATVSENNYATLVIPTGSNSTLLPLPLDVATDGTIYLVSSDKVGTKNAWQIEKINGANVSDLKGQTFQLRACQLDKAADGKLFAKAIGEIDLQFGLASCTSVLNCLQLIDSKLLTGLFNLG